MNRIDFSIPYNEDTLRASINDAHEFYAPLCLKKTFEEYVYKTGGGKKGKHYSGSVLESKILKYRSKYETEFQNYIDKRINDIHKLYINSSNSNFESSDLKDKGLKVLGSEFLREKNLAKDLHSNFGILNIDNSGSILFINKEKWDLLANDAVMLGAFHACQDIVLWHEIKNNEKLKPMMNRAGEPTIDLDILWDKEERRLRVTGREIVQAMLAGYEVDKSFTPTLGIHLVCKDLSKARNMTLKKACEAAIKMLPSDIYKFFKQDMHHLKEKLPELVARQERSKSLSQLSTNSFKFVSAKSFSLSNLLTKETK